MAEVSLVNLPLDECHSTLVMISQHWFRYQAITWTNVDPDLCRLMASPRPNELTLSSMWVDCRRVSDCRRHQVRILATCLLSTRNHVPVSEQNQNQSAFGPQNSCLCLYVNIYFFVFCLGLCHCVVSAIQKMLAGVVQSTDCFIVHP